MKKLILFTVVFLLSISLVNAQEQSDSTKIERPIKGKLYFAPMPIIAVNPTYGVLYGIAFSTNVFLGEPETTRMSTTLGAATHSTNKQLMFSYKTNVYTNNDDWILLGDWRYFDTSQPTYGLGTGPQSAKLAGNSFPIGDEGAFSTPIKTAQMMEFKYIRFHESALKRIRTNFYIGAGYHFDWHYEIKDHLLELDPVDGSDPVITSHYAYSKAYEFNPEEYILSGLSLNVLLDSRDNAATPYKGQYALATFRMNPTFLGSTKNSSSLWLEYRKYISMSKKHPQNLIGVWAYGNFQTSGDLPYLDLPAIGWDQFGKSGRAYTQGRFRGQNLLYTEVEYRFRLAGFKNNPNFLGAVVFANATTASRKEFTDDNNLTYNGINMFQYVEPAVGFGLRFMVSKVTRSNLTLDYAWGMHGSHGFFLNFNESF